MSCRKCGKEITDRGKNARYHLACKNVARKAWAKTRPSRPTRKPYDDWKAYGLPQPVEEYRFHPQRLWRLDWAFPGWRIGIEQDGGLWTRGAHSRGIGRLRDMEKDRAAMLLGWRVGRFSPEEVRNGVAAIWVKSMMTELVRQAG